MALGMALSWAWDFRLVPAAKPVQQRFSRKTTPSGIELFIVYSHTETKLERIHSYAHTGGRGDFTPIALSAIFSQE